MSDEDIVSDVEVVEISSLTPYVNNPKKHPESQIDKLKGSIKEFGFTVPMVVDEEGTIIAGHGRFEAAKQLGMEKVPVIERSDLSEAQAKAFRLADNKIAESEWDDDALSVELESLDEDFDFDLDLTGFDEVELDELDNKVNKQDTEIEESKISIPDNIKDWKILNLYAGIGGNRRFWPDECDVVHVEYREEIAKALRKIHPEDKVVIGDAHKYLLEHFDEFDFIWTSPPCPTHSRLRKAGVGKFNQGNTEPKYPDMELYQEILFLKGYFNGMWVVENVKSWYDPLIEPQQRGRHYYWANFDIPDKQKLESGPEIGSEMVGTIEEETMKKKAKQFGMTEEQYGFIPSLSDYPKDKIIRNMVHPDIGEVILKAAFEQKGDLNE